MSSMDSANPLHSSAHESTAWTRVNMAEGIPGVATPLSWTFWGDALELMMRQAHVDMGVFKDATVPPQGDPDRVISIFFGRTSLNVDGFRKFAEAAPWSKPSAVEEAYFGKVREGVEERSQWQRYPIAAAKTLPLAITLPGVIRRQYAETKVWWRQMTGADGIHLSAAERFRLGQERFALVGRPHCACAMVAGALAQQLAKICAKADRMDLFMTLLGGHTSVEIETTSAMWDVSRGERELEDFLDEFGFQGHLQGELSSRPWRDQPDPVSRLVTTFASMSPSEAPQIAEKQRVAAREAAEREVLERLPFAWKHRAKLVFRGLGGHMPGREYGKASLMMALDVARVAARDLGSRLVADGVLDDVEDVFYLTVEEILADSPPVDARDLVALRRATRTEYEQLTVPESWIGMPVPVADEERDDDSLTLTALSGGIGVSPGVIEARARVITDVFGDEDIEPGEILVCETTDPSWAPYFMVASGVVMDIGGAMSHGAIVAREAGIPGVVNVGNGTAVLRSGDLLRVDGTTGEVSILERAAVAP